MSTEEHSPKTILVAEDEAAILMLLRDLLEHAGYSVITAVDGEEALRKLGERRVDLAIADLAMSGMNGLQLLDKIRERNPDVVALLATSYTEDEIRCKIKQDIPEYVELLHKLDYPPKMLLQKVKKLLFPVSAATK